MGTGEGGRGRILVIGAGLLHWLLHSRAGVLCMLWFASCLNIALPDVSLALNVVQLNVVCVVMH